MTLRGFAPSIPAKVIQRETAGVAEMERCRVRICAFAAGRVAGSFARFLDIARGSVYVSPGVESDSKSGP
eukprot:8030586-Alexandrium_andersonii.AAC.1